MWNKNISKFEHKNFKTYQNLFTVTFWGPLTCKVSMFLHQKMVTVCTEFVAVGRFSKQSLYQPTQMFFFLWWKHKLWVPSLFENLERIHLSPSEWYFLQQPKNRTAKPFTRSVHVCQLKALLQEPRVLTGCSVCQEFWAKPKPSWRYFI